MSKIDCSNIFNFMREWNRRKKESNESFCSIEEYAKRGGFEHKKTLERSVDLLQKWSDSHPCKTRKDSFMKLLKENGFERIVKHKMERNNGENYKKGCVICLECRCEECKKYWNEYVD